jgi:CRISPR/Cas system-associated exonuclease Cas4 (RecB family)
VKILCPDKSEKEIEDCIACSKCYPRPIIEMLLKGRNKKKKKKDHPRYGVTRLVGNCLRKTYYDLTEEVARPLDKMWIFTRGTAIHEFVQKDIPEEDVEIFREAKFSTFSVLGFIDAVHDGALYEFKTTANIPSTPQESHVLQSQAYYSMLDEEMRSKVEKILVIYFSMHKIRVFEVKPRDVMPYLEARGTILTNALKNSTPPKREESYLCDYCDFKDICFGHKSATHKPKQLLKDEKPSQSTLL